MLIARAPDRLSHVITLWSLPYEADPTELHAMVASLS
jgi:hypothetical protein